MSKPRIVRTRKRPKTDAAEEAAEVAEEAPTPTPSRRAAPAPKAAEKEPAPSREPTHRPLDADDLMAIASMDGAELAALMEGNLPAAQVESGARVTGHVSRIGAQDVFVEIGAKSEATMDRAELPDASVGDEVEAMVLYADDTGIRLSRNLSGQAALDHLDDALETGVPVEGTVMSRNRGGFEVGIGSVRAFCPISRISRLQAADPDSFVGQVLSFRVIETGDKVVVDRRVLQEEEVAAKAEELWATLQVGDSRRGTVRNVQPFGTFVDLGGVDGLVPAREWSGPDAAIGQGVEVRVLEIDRVARRLTLSARNPDNDPWNAVGAGFRVGGVYEGTVVRVAPFGVFVALADGLDGLVHISRLPTGAPKVGTSLTVKLVSVDRDRQRLELTPVSGDAVEAPVGQMVKGVVSQVLRNGLVLQLDDGRSGWIPDREVELEPGTVLAQRYRKGRSLEARVTQDGGQRVVLSLREDPAEAESAWRSHVGASEKKSEGFGTLGDLLSGLELPKK